MAAAYTIRHAQPSDIDTLAAFTLQEAREAEAFDADPSAVRRGVEAAFSDLPPSTYWVAEWDGQAVASVSAVKEWSDFRGGYYWWIQSVFVVAEHRGHGLLRLLLDHVAGVAKAAGALDLRLYAHASNERALQGYRRNGFTAAPYVLMTKRL